MKKIHIFAPQNHSNGCACANEKMASHSFVTRHCEAVQRHDHNYYPYGGIIGDISTNESLQKYKLFHYIPREQARSEGPRSHQKEIDNLLARRRAFRRGVELDRTFGLDNYDIHARQYYAMMPSWDKIDPLAEKYYGISPYAYCGGDPVNFGDYNGEDAIVSVYGDTITISANVILTGSQASQELADIYQQGINETWGSISTFEYEGKTYNLVWDIKVEANAGLDINDNLPRDGRTNYLQVIGEPRSGGKGSSVIYGYKGFIRAYGEDGLSLNESNPLPHEFGHLIGLKDRYFHE